jgi:hypothetical protein
VDTTAAPPFDLGEHCCRYDAADPAAIDRENAYQPAHPRHRIHARLGAQILATRGIDVRTLARRVQSSCPWTSAARSAPRRGPSNSGYWIPAGPCRPTCRPSQNPRLFASQAWCVGPSVSLRAHGGSAPRTRRHHSPSLQPWPPARGGSRDLEKEERHAARLLRPRAGVVEFSTWGSAR